MDTAILPELTAVDIPLDVSPDCFGTLTSSMDLIDDVDALRARMQAEGYLYLPGYLDRDEVMAARAAVAERIAVADCLQPGTPVIDLIPRADSNGDSMYKHDLAHNNQPLQRLLQGGRMIDFYQRFLGGEVRHFDYTWMRAVLPGRGTPPHMDIVFMGRGTTNLYTTWTPLGDIPISMGGLMILQGSHLHDRLNRGYGRKDVDAYCVNRREQGFDKMGGGGNIARDGVLSRNPAKLRERLGGRWLTANYQAGDMLVFSMYTVHTSLDNHSERIRLSSDTRYQLASEPVDERWIGEHPIKHGPDAKRGMIC